MGFTAPFGFALPTRIEFGIGILAKLPAVLRENPGKRIMIVTDRIIGSLGWFRSVLDLLDREGFTVKVFDGVRATRRTAMSRTRPRWPARSRRTRFSRSARKLDRLRQGRLRLRRQGRKDT
jgi:hypothetical protein